MSDINSIPFGQLLENCAKLQSIDKRFSYLYTLKKNPILGVNTVGDYLSITSPKKKVKDLQDAITEHLDDLTNLISSTGAIKETSVVTVPYSNTTGDIYEMMRSFIRDYVLELDNLCSNKKVRFKPWTIQALRMRYVWESPKDNRAATLTDIATSVGLSNERVRQTLVHFREMAFEILSGQKSVYGIVASSEMQTVFNSFKDALSPVVLLHSLKNSLGVFENDNRTVLFFLDGMGYNISDDLSICVKRELGVNALDFVNKNKSRIVSYLKEKAVPVRLNLELIPDMKKLFGWNKNQIDVMIEYVHADREKFEFSTDSYGDDVISLKWQWLTEKNRIVRVIYDYNAEKGWDRYMSLKELKDEYNRRAAKTGVDAISSNPSADSPLIEGLGNGQYRFCAGKVKKDRPDMIAEVRKFVANNGGMVLFDDLATFVRSINPTYTDSSVYGFARKAECRQKTINGSRFVVHKDFLGKLGIPGLKAKPQLVADKAIRTVAEILSKEGRQVDFSRELIPLFLGRYGIKSVNAVSLRNILKKAEGTLFKFPKGCISLAIPKDQIDKIDFTQF